MTARPSWPTAGALDEGSAEVFATRLLTIMRTGRVFSVGRAIAAIVGAAFLTHVQPAPGQLPPIPEVTPEETGNQPKLFVAQRMVDLGTVFEGDRVPLEWTLENRGGAELVIESTKASCGCTIVSLSEADRVIPPGGRLALKADFNSTGRRGAQTKTVTVQSNDPLEPKLKLEFRAAVITLFEMKPAGVLNLQGLQRGTPAGPALEFYMGGSGGQPEVVKVELPEAIGLVATTESSQSPMGPVAKVRFAATEETPLGPLSGEVKVTVRVDGKEQERSVSLRGEVVGDITWNPKVLDATRFASQPGKRLAPVTLRASNEVPFKVVRSSINGPVDAECQEVVSPRPGTHYTCFVTVREGAEAGPFGALLRVETSSLDQPRIDVPVYGLVAAPLEVDPPTVVLRQDGSAIGRQRRVRLQVSPQTTLDIQRVACDHPAVSVSVDEETRSRYQHLRVLVVRLSGSLEPGAHRAMLVVETTVPGAERLEIPVLLEAPG